MKGQQVRYIRVSSTWRQLVDVQLREGYILHVHSIDRLAWNLKDLQIIKDDFNEKSYHGQIL